MADTPYARAITSSARSRSKNVSTVPVSLTTPSLPSTDTSYCAMNELRSSASRMLAAIYASVNGCFGSISMLFRT
jgi:hypothetical protein